MLGKIWQWLKRFFSSLFGSGGQTTSTARERSAKQHRRNIESDRSQQSPPPLTDTDYEYLFTELLEGVSHGWNQARVLQFFDKLGERGKPELWVAWLNRFGERLISSSAPNSELAMRMVLLGELDCGEITTISYQIGSQLLSRQPSGSGVIWEYDGADIGGENADYPFPESQPQQEPEGMETISLEELFIRLQQDPNLVQQLAQQFGVETTEPEVVMEAIVNHFNATNQSHPGEIS